MNKLYKTKIQAKLTSRTVRYLIVLLIFSAFSFLNVQENQLYSQGNDKKDTIAKFYLGGYGGYNLNMQFGNFTEIKEDCPTCVGIDYGDYGFTTGSGFAIGGLFELPLYKKDANEQIIKPANKIAPMSVGLRLGYSNLSANYNVEAKIGNVLTSGNTVTDGISAHILETDISVINISPYFSYNLTGNLVGNIGLNLGYLLTNKFNQREELVSPEGIVFKEEQSRIRNKFDNQEITEANKLQFGLGLGLGYQLPLGKHSFIVPEINYNFNFTDVSSNLSWQTSALQIGVALKFPILDKPTVEQIIPEIYYQRDTTIAYKTGISAPEIVLENSTKTPQGNDTLIIESYVKYMPQLAELTANLSYYAMEKGERKNVPSVTIEEFETTESFPLLPIIYFKDGDFNLNQTKVNLLSPATVNDFNENQSKAEIFNLYYDMLNVLAKRLKSSKAQITISGYSSGAGKDLEDKNIWQKRANAVKDYFVNVWGINENQLKVTHGEAEKRDISSSSYNDVVEENQKVQIFTSNSELLKPVVLSEIEKISNPPQIIFEMKANSGNELKDYSLNIAQANTNLRKYSENINQNNFGAEKSWNIAEEPMPVLEQPVSIDYTVTDKADQQKTVTENISIQQKTIKTKRTLVENDMKIERYSLVLFDIDKADLTTLHRKILDDIKKSIQPNSKLYIYGYADRTGDKQYNENLALRRCERINNYINAGNKINAELEAIGSNILIYNNDTPEGRALSRTVKIEIRTPIK